jgi:hypothetical protein
VIAKFWREPWSSPRWAIRLVTDWNASLPRSVNSNETFGAFVFGSWPCFGSLTSEPVSSESSSTT